jgi:CDP-diglyceride synthetase
MIQRILTALVLIPLVLLLILRAPVWVLTLVAGVVALLAIREFLELTKKYGTESSSCAIYTTAGFFLAVAYLVRYSPTKLGLELLDILFVAVAMMPLVPFVSLALGMRRSNLSSIYPSAAAGVFALAYIALPMSLLVFIRAMDYQGGNRLIFLMIVVWSGDIFAYFVGKAIQNVASYKSEKDLGGGRCFHSREFYFWNFILPVRDHGKCASHASSRRYPTVHRAEHCSATRRPGGICDQAWCRR